MISTSLEAYNSILPDLQKKEKQVIACLFMIGPSTNEEIGNYLGWAVNRITGRTNSLLKKGILARGERVKGTSGRPAYKLVIQSYQMKLL